MRICVFGAGAVGGFLAHGLSQVDGVELSVVARGAHLDAIKSSGIRLITSAGESSARPANASSDPANLGAQDVIINCVKSHQAWASADDVKPLLGPETCVVTCQNGVPWWYFHKIGGQYEDRKLDAVDRDDRQWLAVGPDRAIGSVIYTAAEIVGPGVIRHISGNTFILGEPDGSQSSRLSSIAGALEAAGFNARMSTDIRSDIWLKLWGNLCFNPISALTGETLEGMARDPGSCAVARSLMEESRHIAEKLGAQLSVSIDERIRMAEQVGAHRTSMLQDLEAGKAMEIDALVTVVQEMGRIVDVPTPSLDLVLALVQQLGQVRGLYPTYP